MNLSIKLRRILIIALLFLTYIPNLSSADVQPWEAYSQFIPSKTPVVKRDFRATWICTVANMDWPSAATRNIKNNTTRIRKSKDELIAILDKVQKLNMNAVFFQVSPEGDAFYKSSVVPWSRYLTGTFGKNPGFDPLAFAIQEAHKRNLEFHAWFNPYRVTTNTSKATKASLKINRSVYKNHPDWIRTAADMLVVDPGIPEARKWVAARVMEVVKNYDVDGIHFDDYFYNENKVGELKDDATYIKYNKKFYKNKGDWRRNNTYLLVKEISQKIKAVKPYIKYGISPAAVWANQKDGHRDGSNTTTTYPNYERCFADVKKWVTQELVDYLVPQIYMSYGNQIVPYGEITTWWANLCMNYNVQLYIGHALYKTNDNPDKYFNGSNAVSEFSHQLRFNLANSSILGSVMFRVLNFNDKSKQQVVKAIQGDLWATKSLIPVMDWKKGKAPQVPINAITQRINGGVKLKWKNKDPKTNYFAIYRVKNGEDFNLISDKSGSNLIATVKKSASGTQEFIDKANKVSIQTYYVITALDRLHNESNGVICNSIK